MNYYQAIRITMIFALSNLLLFGCSQDFDIDTKTPIEIMYPTTEHNSIIELRNVGSFIEGNSVGILPDNEVNLGESVVLELNNNSDREIIFDCGFGVISFAYDFKSNIWIEMVDNRILSCPGDQLVLLPSNDPEYNPRPFNYDPTLPIGLDKSSEIPIKVYSIGKAYQSGNEPDTVVVAFYDLLFVPQE